MYVSRVFSRCACFPLFGPTRARALIPMKSTTSASKSHNAGLKMITRVSGLAMIVSTSAATSAFVSILLFRGSAIRVR